MINKIKKILTVLFACIILAGCSAALDISYAKIEKSGFFIVGYDPESYHTLGGYGLAIDIIKHAAQRMDINAPIKPVTFYDWQVQLENQDIDVMLCANSDDNFQTIELFNDDIVLIISNYETEKIGVMDSAACIEQKNILSHNNDYKYLYYSDKQLLLNDLELGILDGGIMSEYDALSYVNISNYKVQVLNQIQNTFIVSKNSSTFFNELNSTLTQMVNDGTINRLKQEYINSLK